MNIIIANWKMNPNSTKDVKALFESVAQEARHLKNVEIVICPPACFLPLFGGQRSVKLGGQNLFWELQGAYTGEISGKMLKDLNCDYVILGHSERRQYAGETDEIVSSKLKMALKCGLTPILCVGEKAGDEMSEVVAAQIKNCLSGVAKSQLEKIIITYEPVWAISSGILGTGDPCLPDRALSAGLFIKKILTELYGRFLAEKVKIIYGGSVDSGNAVSYIKEAQMQGALVGGASLEAEEFVKIGEAVNGL